MNNCPCCSTRLLRQIRSREVYFFCRQCWQEMPILQQTYHPELFCRLVDKPSFLKIDKVITSDDKQMQPTHLTVHNQRTRTQHW